MPKNLNQFARKLIHNPCKPAIAAPCLAPKLTADQRLGDSSRATGVECFGLETLQHNLRQDQSAERLPTPLDQLWPAGRRRQSATAAGLETVSIPFVRDIDRAEWRFIQPVPHGQRVADEIDAPSTDKAEDAGALTGLDPASGLAKALVGNIVPFK
jgi:hypothetical protein